MELGGQLTDSRWLLGATPLGRWDESHFLHPAAHHEPQSFLLSPGCRDVGACSLHRKLDIPLGIAAFLSLPLIPLGSRDTKQEACLEGKPVGVAGPPLVGQGPQVAFVIGLQDRASPMCSGHLNSLPSWHWGTRA